MHSCNLMEVQQLARLLRESTNRILQSLAADIPLVSTRTLRQKKSETSSSYEKQGNTGNHDRLRTGTPSF